FKIVFVLVPRGGMVHSRNGQRSNTEKLRAPVEAERAKRGRRVLPNRQEFAFSRVNESTLLDKPRREISRSNFGQASYLLISRLVIGTRSLPTRLFRRGPPIITAGRDSGQA